MDLVVRLRPETAGAALQRVEAVLVQMGATMTPQFPGAADTELAGYYVVSGLPDSEGERVAAALRELDGVEAAYEQPRPSPA
ncbi:MAG TPA: hypothetical protein VMP67_12160 [Candidatus Limnocylindria bacterium]|nr:hypothetical protein [Candidatus Limnocylindria bacterium]